MSPEALLARKVVAKIFVDGCEFMDLFEGDEHRQLEMFNETVKRVGGEVALLVYKPRYDVWLRERLYITASK